MPKFSFVIPCYKSSDVISRCLGSIIDQDFKDFEIICVLDGPDEIAKDIISAFKEAKCVEIEHGGPCKARNKGLEVSKGEFVIFSDCDMFWKPGILRTFSETLDKTGADFAYAGYRYEDYQGGHMPMDFDAYLFTVFNYVDGANPIKTDLVRKIGGWSEGLDRFQDWDLWIRLTKAGAVGVKIEGIAKDTKMPDKNAISGKDNYERCYFEVRELNNLPDRRICVTSIAAPQHALRIAKLCDWDYWPQPRMLPKEYDAIYVLGCFPESIQDHVNLFMSMKGVRRECQYLIHWIGTDVLNMLSKFPYLYARNIRMMFEKYDVKQFTQSQGNHNEMEELGFKTEVLPLPVELKTEESAMPNKFTVAVYDHNGADEKWHKSIIIELTKALPDVHWLFFGNRNAVGKSKNTEWVGNQPIKEIIKRASCLMRLTIHDGYPVSPIEFMYSGRKVITNVKDMPFTNYVNLGEVNQDRFQEIKKLVLDEVRKVKKSPKFSPEEKEKLIEYYNQKLSPQKFKEKIENVIKRETPKD